MDPSSPTRTTHRACRPTERCRPRGSADRDDAPSVAVERTGVHDLTVYATWNGATEVRRWVVLGGTDATRLDPIGSGPRSGFETTLRVTSDDVFVAVRSTVPAVRSERPRRSGFPETPPRVFGFLLTPLLPYVQGVTRYCADDRHGRSSPTGRPHPDAGP